MSSVKERLLKYVQYDTQADDRSDSVPSSAKQLKLAQALYDECQAMGFDHVSLSKEGYVYATLESTGLATNIGLCSHMDTALELPGKANPQVIEKYDGKDIVLANGAITKVSEHDILADLVGHELIVTDGSTLLGADDKAGIAIILTALEKIMASSQPHGRIVVCFTVDEEIGRGVDHIDLDQFNVDFAYTIDGDVINSITYETFNAASAKITITGNSIHPGEAKNKMVNASLLAYELINLLPEKETPAHTEGREGFYHLVQMQGECEQASLEYIIRDHDWQHFQERKQTMATIVEQMNERYPQRFVLDMKDSYHNMVQYMNGDMRSVQRAQTAIQAVGLEPVSIPIRGGTDGSRLTEMGVITPNLGTGSYLHHGRHELASVQQMNTMVDIVCHILYQED